MGGTHPRQPTAGSKAQVVPCTGTEKQCLEESLTDVGISREALWGRTESLWWGRLGLWNWQGV